MKKARAIKTKNGFTLVELLVSFSVLSIIIIGLATMMGFVAKTWLYGVNSGDNFMKARVVMGLVDRDIQMMVLRRDLPSFVDNLGNPACAFYTNVEGSANNTRTVSLVQYKLANPTTAPTLQRLDYAANFSSVMPTVGTSNLSQLSNANVVTETVFNGIIRFQIQFVDGSGTILTPAPTYTLTSSPPYTSSNKPPYMAAPPTGSPTPATSFWFDFYNPGASYNPRSVVISMVVLSDAAYKIAQLNSTAMTSLLNDFPVSSTGLPSAMPSTTTSNGTYASQTYAQYWDSILNPTSGSFDSSLPAAIRDRGAIQVYERHIPLPLTTPSN